MDLFPNAHLGLFALEASLPQLVDVFDAWVDKQQEKARQKGYHSGKDVDGASGCQEDGYAHPR